MPKFPRCGECGGSVQLLKGLGRTRKFTRDVVAIIPATFEIPTCISCGEEYMSPDISDRLDALYFNRT